MKTAISLPDDLYAAAERLGKGLRLSRSKLYARALEQYIEEMNTEHVTAALNEIYQAPLPEADEFLTLAASNTLKNHPA